METSTVATEIGYRQNLYRFFANLFGTEPTLDILEQLSLPEVQKSFRTMGADYQEKLWKQPRSELKENLEVEYAQLFLTPKTSISLHESLQKGEGQYWGDSTVSVNQFYQLEGYKINDSFKAMPDHISAQLECVSFLVATEDKLTKKSATPSKIAAVRQKQLVFLESHLAGWLPSFVEQVKVRAKYRFYQVFAELLGQFIANELQQLKSV